MPLIPTMGEWTILERLLEAAVQQHSTMIGRWVQHVMLWTWGSFARRKNKQRVHVSSSVRVSTACFYVHTTHYLKYTNAVWNAQNVNPSLPPVSEGWYSRESEALASLIPLMEGEVRQPGGTLLAHTEALDMRGSGAVWGHLTLKDHSAFIHGFLLYLSALMTSFLLCFRSHHVTQAHLIWVFPQFRSSPPLIFLFLSLSRMKSFRNLKKTSARSRHLWFMHQFWQEMSCILVWISHSRLL